MKMSREMAVLLEQLRENSRKSLSEISRECEISIPRLSRLLKSLEKNVIKKYFSIMDYGLLGYNIRMLFFFEAGNPDELDDFISGERSINSCSHFEGGYFSLECVFRNMRELSEFRERLSGLDISGLQEHFVTEALKEERFVPE